MKKKGPMGENEKTFQGEKAANMDQIGIQEVMVMNVSIYQSEPLVSPQSTSSCFNIQYNYIKLCPTPHSSGKESLPCTTNGILPSRVTESMVKQEILDDLIHCCRVVMQIDTVTRVGLNIRRKRACLGKCAGRGGRDRGDVGITSGETRSPAEDLIVFCFRPVSVMTTKIT
jgi:hypothetical protein